MAIQINETNFDKEVLKSDVPVLVDFWAPWCAPCKTLGPMMDTLHEKLKGKAKVCKVNVDENPDLANRYGIRGIPTVITFDQGKSTETIVGVNNEAAYLNSLKLN
jgi:thioredoxin 1